jgi:carboxyl-terminal processing protease
MMKRHARQARLLGGVAGGLLALLCGSCDRPGSPNPTAGAPSASSRGVTTAPGGNSVDNGGLQPAASVSSAPFTGGEQAFHAVKEALRAKYYRAGLTDDEIYRAAVAGMLQQLEPQLGAWNKLLSPEEIEELHADMRGSIVGIGVEIRFDNDSGTSDVLGVMPGSPAERAGIRDGDKILTVAGKFYKGKTLRDVVADLRGKPGETVKLSILRDTEVLSFSIERQRVSYDVVRSLMLPGDIGYLAIRQFNESTVGAVENALRDLQARRARGLVIDLRGNQGGLFEKAVATAELFLKKGTPIVKIRHRSGQEESLSSKGSAALSWTGLPLALIIDRETASSGELLAGALREGAGAQLIGQKTFGKGTIQNLEELPNKYAFKYTVSVFVLPSGQPIEGAGLTPDVDVALPIPEQSNYERQLSRLQHMQNPNERIQADAQLRAAVNVARLQIH